MGEEDKLGKEMENVMDGFLGLPTPPPTRERVESSCVGIRKLSNSACLILRIGLANDHAWVADA